MMGIMAQRAFEAEESARSTFNERQVLSSAARPAKVEKRQITRNRTSYSCHNCRKRKIKCDKEHPKCGACLKNGDVCIYGKMDTGGGESRAESDEPSAQKAPNLPDSTSDEHWSRVLPQGSAPKSQLDHLSALESQLARLTSMVESLRKDGSLPDANGLQTPSSSRSPNTDHASYGHDGSPAHVDAASALGAEALDRPMSELEITRQKAGQIGDSRSMFWESVSEELDQLQLLLKGPFSSAPTARIGEPTCAGGSRPDPFQPMPQDDNRAPIGFHQAVQNRNHSKPTEKCSLCQQASTNKSIFLLGLTTQQMRTTPKVDLAVGIPSEAQSNALFRAWITGVFPILPFLAVRRAFRRYISFWEWKRQYDYSPEAVTESADIYFLPVLNIIWYSGVLAMSIQGIQTWFPGRTRAELAAHYHDQVVKYLAFLSFPSNIELPFIAALMTLEFMLGAEQDPLQSSSYLNLILRLGQNVGLNRESGQPGATPYEVEMRRRLWPYIVKLDTALCISSGMPSSIDDDLTDSLPISEVKEYHIGSEAERNYKDDIKSGRQKIGVVDDPYGTTRSIVSAYHLVSKASSMVDETLRRIMRIHMNPRQITRETLNEMNTIINDTENFVKDIISSIPTKGVPELGFEPEAGNIPVYDCDSVLGSPVEEAELSSYLGNEPSGLSSNLARYHRQKLCAFHKWARITLSLMCDKMHCIAYAPFLKNARSKLWSAARQCALHHATSFLRKFVCLASDPLLEPFRWSWPAMHQPMHAAIIILVDVYERPFSVEAPRNRSWIDKVFALGDPIAGIVGELHGSSTQRPLRDGGADAWDQLRGLRSSAWRRAGLDPDVLWTEEDQMLVGIAKPLTEEQRIAQTIREDVLYDSRSKRPAQSSNNTATLRGVRYLLDLGREEAKSMERAHILEYAISGQAEQVFATIKPSASRTVKLEGQQRMPFPLSPEIAHRCTKAEKDHDDSVAQQLSSSAETIFMDDLVRRIKHYADKHPGPTDSTGYLDQRGGTDKSTRNAYEGQDKVQSVYNMVAPHLTATTKRSDDPSKRTFNGIVPNGLQIDYSTVQEPQSEMPTTGSESGADMTASMGESSASFDWEKWDAVFGQYGGFTEVMEDIQWEEPDHT